MIRLRKVEPTDLPYLYQWENDAASWGDSSTHNPLSQQDLRDYIQSTTGDIYRDGQLRLMAELTTTGETVGVIDLFDFDPRNQRAAIGMYVSPNCRGKGVGREMLGQLERYAFGFLGLRMLYAVIGVNNEACMAIYREADYLSASYLREWTIDSDAVVWQKFAKKEA